MAKSVIGLLFFCFVFFSVPACWAEALRFEDILQQSLAHSYDLRLANLDRQISEVQVIAARADYYPIVKGQLNTEYLKDLTDGKTSVTTVGNTILPVGTRFQNAISLSVTQTLFDFGVRHRKLDIAKKDVHVKHEAAEQARRTVTLKVVDLYAQALSAFKSMRAKQAVLAVYQQIFQMKQRLFEAGKVSKVEVADEAIQVAQTVHDIQTCEDQLRIRLADLSFYTKNDYDARRIELQDFEDEPLKAALTFHPEQSSEYREYALQIAQKKEELQVQKRQALPQLAFYGTYSLYGFDTKNWALASGDIRNRLFSVGLSLSMPLFDGFKNSADVKKVELEIQRLQVERDKKLDELNYQFRNFMATAQGGEAENETQRQLSQEAFQKLTLTERLSVRQLVERTQQLKAQADWLTKNWDIEQVLIKKIAAYKKMKILAAG